MEDHERGLEDNLDAEQLATACCTTEQLSGEGHVPATDMDLSGCGLPPQLTLLLAQT